MEVTAEKEDTQEKKGGEWERVALKGGGIPNRSKDQTRVGNEENLPWETVVGEKEGEARIIDGQS